MLTFQDEGVKGVRCSNFLAFTALGDSFPEYIATMEGYEEDIYIDLTQAFVPKLYEYYTLYVLGLLLAFDLSKQAWYLSLSRRILEFLENRAKTAYDRDVTKINHLQIKY